MIKQHGKNAALKGIQLKRFSVRLVLCTLLVASLLAGSVPAIQVAHIFAKAHFSQLLLDRAWSKSLRQGKVVKPWPWLDSHPVARLTTGAKSKQQNRHIVLAGASGQAMAFGPTQLTLPHNPSTLPYKTSDHESDKLTIIAGHRDTHLRFLEGIETGEQIHLQRITGRQTSFQVQELQIVDTEQQELVIDDALEGLLLITCYPFNTSRPGGPLRLVVYATELTQQPQANL